VSVVVMPGTLGGAEHSSREARAVAVRPVGSRPPGRSKSAR
jgi:hypothetical protein